MDRRRFLAVSSSAVAAPVLPAFSFASSVTTPTATQMAWAAQYARVHNTASAARLQAAFGMSASLADQVMAGLSRTGVIASGSSGCVAVRPIMPLTHELGGAIAQVADSKPVRRQITEALGKADQRDARSEADPAPQTAPDPSTEPHEHPRKSELTGDTQVE